MSASAPNLNVKSMQSHPRGDSPPCITTLGVFLKVGDQIVCSFPQKLPQEESTNRREHFTIPLSFLVFRLLLARDDLVAAAAVVAADDAAVVVVAAAAAAGGAKCHGASEASSDADFAAGWPRTALSEIARL